VIWTVRVYSSELKNGLQDFSEPYRGVDESAAQIIFRVVQDSIKFIDPKAQVELNVKDVSGAFVRMD